MMVIMRLADQSACLYSYTGICLQKAPLQEYHVDLVVSTMAIDFFGVAIL